MTRAQQRASVDARSSPTQEDRPKADPVAGPRVLQIQRSAGNRAATAYVQQGRMVPVQRNQPTVARIPAPTAVVHEHRQLTPDYEATDQLLDRLIVEQGWKATDSWAYRFINADPLGDLKYGSDLDLVGRCRQRLRTEMTIRGNKVKDLTGAAGADYGDVVMAGGQFVTTATEVTKELLTNSEKQLKSEAAHYGLKVDNWVVYKSYSMAGGQAQQGLRDAAKRLAAQRRTCNTQSKAFFKAQDAAEADARRMGPFLPIAAPLLEAQEAARKVWVDGEEAYRAAASKEQILYPVLAAYTTLDDAAAQLDALAAKDSAALAESLYKTIDDRLKNIEKVRDEIGDKYNPWKHAQIVALTKKQLSLPPWQIKVIDEKVAAVRGEKAEDPMFWAAIAIGLGLLGAIPSGGSTVLVGVAAAANIVGAAYSLNALFEHYKDYSLAKAETGVTLDKAMAISQEEPSLMWLAFDMLDLAANALGPAAAAFKELRAAMAAAKAKNGATELKALALAAHARGAKPQTVSRMFASIFEGMGAGQSVDNMMKAIKDALVAANPAPGKVALRNAILEAAERLGSKKIVRYGGVNRGAAIKGLEEAIAASHPGRYRGNALKEIALRAAKDFDQAGHTAGYARELDFIIMRPEGELSSALAHEMSHRAQMIEQQIEAMGTLRREFQAFHVEREVLLMLPDELAQASSTAWLRTAKDDAILAYIRTNPAYSAAVAAEELANPGINVALDTAADAALIEKWFLQGSAAK